MERVASPQELIFGGCDHAFVHHYDQSVIVPVHVPVGVTLTEEAQHWLPELVQAVVFIAQQENWAGPGPSQMLPTRIQVTEVAAGGDMCCMSGDELGSLHSSCCGQHPD